MHYGVIKGYREPKGISATTLAHNTRLQANAILWYHRGIIISMTNQMKPRK